MSEKIISGELIRAGTMEVDGEMDTGIFIACTKDELKAMPVSLYKFVDVYISDKQ
jgi:hypothetical protein